MNLLVFARHHLSLHLQLLYPSFVILLSIQRRNLPSEFEAAILGTPIVGYLRLDPVEGTLLVLSVPLSGRAKGERRHWKRREEREDLGKSTIHREGSDDARKFQRAYVDGESRVAKDRDSRRAKGRRRREWEGNL
jgi:hypothetical protein